MVGTQRSEYAQYGWQFDAAAAEESDCPTEKNDLIAFLEHPLAATSSLLCSVLKLGLEEVKCLHLNGTAIRTLFR